MVSFPKYEKYQDTGEDWLGEIPQHWQLLRTKNIFRLVAEPAPKNNDEELLSIYSDIGVKPRKELEERGNKASTTDGYWFVKKGDVIVNKLLAWMGAIGVSDYDGVTSPAYDILRAYKPIESKFYHYLFRSPICISKLKQHSKGIMEMRLRLYFDEFGNNIKIPYPPLEDQQRIVEFLDRKTSEIDQAIAQKQRLIELLQEQKAILINQAVTKGLNPNVPMRDSGNLWLGKIPEYWDIKPLKTFFSFISYGFTNPMPTTEQGPLMLTSNDIGEGFIKYESARHTSEKAFKSKLTDKSRPKIKDILVTKDGTLGRTAIVDKDIEICISQSVALLRPKNGVNERFLEMALRAKSYQDAMIFDAGGTTIKHIYITRLAKLNIAMPTENEQSEIVNYCLKIEKDCKTIISRIIDEMNLLTEFKSNLIANTVTGKIKV